MTNRISVSRAARLVGVKRGTLQQKIRMGDLKTFEGEIVLTDLLQAYPDAEIEDSSMLERVEQIIEQTTFINSESSGRHVDNAALSSRIRAMSQDLYRDKLRIGRYEDLLETLTQRLQNFSQDVYKADELLLWLESERTNLDRPDQEIYEPLVNDAFLRVMTAQATILSSGHEFFVEGVESILEAGLRGGLALNYGCSSGNCGLCKMRVISGETQKIKHHDYLLSEAEKGLRYVLACCNTAVSDVVLDAEEATNTSEIPKQNISIRIKKIDRPNEEILILSTRTPRTNRLRFLAGQRAQLSIDHVGSSLYPIASCPCDDMNLQFHIPIKKKDEIANYINESAKINDLITLEGPIGSFVLDENSPNSLIFFAEGSGFSTIKGLIEHAMALDSAERIIFFWITQDRSELYLNNLCRAWNDALDNFDYIPIDNQAMPGLQQSIIGIIGKQTLAAFDYYLSTSDSLNNQISKFLEGHSIPAKQIHIEQ